MDTDSFAAKERTELKNVGQCVPPVSLQLETTNHAKHAKFLQPLTHADKR